jgi:hypothetical protein
MSRTVIAYTYRVTGMGTFPIDMLRHDRATPYMEGDAAEIERTFQPRARGPWQVRLRGFKSPNEARWQSFRWGVSDIQEIRA